MRKRIKDMSLIEVEKEIRVVKKECKNNGVSYNSNMRFLELTIQKNKLNKPVKMREIEVARVIGSVLNNNDCCKKRASIFVRGMMGINL
ncbi:MAG: hypothetical protein ACRC0G_08640 [Fusobacteriaceae bacterium]